jgi:O-antigen ligase
VPSIPTTTAPIWPRASRLAEPARVAAFAVAVLGVELLLARGVSGPQISRFVFLFAGLFAVAFVFRFPMATVLVFLGLTDFIFAPTFFAYEVGPLSVRPHELALAGLLALAILRPAKQTWGGVPGAALAVFLAMVAVSAAFAVSKGSASLTDAFNWSRPLGMLAFFYVVVRLFPSARQRRLLLTGAAVLAAAAGAVALMVALGAGFGDALQDSGGNVVTQQQSASSVERVRLAGLSAGYALFWYVVVQIAAARGSRRVWWSLALTGIALDIVVSFNRNMWLGILIGLLLMAIVGGAMVRSRIVSATAVAVAALALFVVFGSSTSGDRIIEPVVQRGATIFNPGKAAQENSLKDRARETDAAWATAQDHLLLGVGAGAGFGIVINEPISSGSFIIGFTPVQQLYLHNQYLYLLLIAGIPGLIAFLAFLGVPLAHALRRIPRDPSIAAIGVGVALIMVSSVVAIYFTVEDMTAMLGLLTGVLVADAEDRAAAGESSGLLS